MTISKLSSGMNPIKVWLSLLTHVPPPRPLWLPNLELSQLTPEFADDYCKYFRWHYDDSLRSFLTPKLGNPKYQFSYYQRMHEKGTWNKFEKEVMHRSSRNMICTWRLIDHDYTDARIPCFTLLSARIRQGCLDFTVVFRMRDLIRRMIPNWYALQRMQLDMATKNHLEIGVLNDLSLDWFYTAADRSKIASLLRKYGEKYE
jgi:hypothetical protein